MQKISGPEPKINLLTREDNRKPRGRRAFRISRFIVYLLSILIIAFIVFSYQVIFTNNSMSQVFDGKISILKQLNILAGDGDQLKGEAEDRINFLLLGMGGAGHEGPYLTDTLIFVSIQPSTKKIGMVSIPRDLLVDVPGFGWWKINNANAYGEQKSPNNGSLLTKEVVQNIFNQPIHYYVRVDFSGFEKMIDTLGGIKINVENAFTDFQYPTDDFKYQVVSFEQGWQTMDGDTALKYVRSRHGNNGEGSDFARSQRQQKLISALKDRVFSFKFFLSPRKINKLAQDLVNHLRTDFQPWEIIRLAKLMEQADLGAVETLVMNDAPDGLLYANKVNEAYVLQPRGGDFTAIQYLVSNIFRQQEAVEEQRQKTVNAEIRNGTTVAGLASQNSTDLKNSGIRVMQIGNAPEQNYQKTEVYMLSDKNLPEIIGLLENKYKTTIEAQNIPNWVSEVATADLDFFIILGQDVVPTEENSKLKDP